MKRNFFLVIGIIAMLFPMNLKAQEAPKISGFVQGLWQMNSANGIIKNNTCLQTFSTAGSDLL